MATFLKDRGFAAGYTIISLGVLVLVAGLTVDLSLHAADADLADQEGLLGLGNPGHILFIAGLSSILIGAFLGPYSRWVLPRGSRALSLLVPAVVLVLALSASIGFAFAIDSISDGDGHSSHSPTLAETSHAEPEGVAATGHSGHVAGVLPQHEALVRLEESTFHEPTNTAPVTEENLRFADGFLAQARAETAKYQDVAAARADGYFQITQDLPLIGAHFFKPTNVGSLDPARPGILLYQSDGAGGWKLVGLAYMLPKQPGLETPPDTSFGGLAHWHYHTDLCFKPGVVSIARSAAECPGGLYIPETPWLLHVWAWKDSPEGVFDHANSLLQ